MKIIRTRVVMHHNRQRILLIFDYDPLLAGKIKELLGHNSSKTTEIYTHVTKKGLDKIVSPLDNLNIREK